MNTNASSEQNNSTFNSENKQALAKKYDATHNKLFVLGTLLTFLGLVMLIVGGHRGISGSLSANISSHIPNIWAIIGLYVVILSTAYAILFLPLSFYEGYMLEHKFNLSTQTVWGWIKNTLKSFAVSLIISLILIEATYLILRQTDNYWWIWAGGCWILFSIILNHLAPILLIPIFFKLTPLDNRELADKLKNLARKAGSNVLGVFEIDLSRKTKKANAAFIGMGKTKRILLADTLLQKFTTPEIEVILAHELGHYYFKHLWKLLLINIISTFVGLFIANKVLTACVYKLGFSGIYDIGAFPILALVLFVFTLLILPINNTYSRKLERQADKFSIDLTGNPKGFIDSMNKLADQNLANIKPNPVIHFILHSHPSISERIKIAEKYIIN